MPLATEISRESLAAVANDLVRLKAQYYGKGPTEAKAYMNDEVLVVVLKGGLTTVERTLLGAGEAPLVRQTAYVVARAHKPAALGRLLDVHVQRLATISHGDGVCTTYIPALPATEKAVR
jgi:hypothetical protein